MTLTLDLSPELEAQLREIIAHQDGDAAWRFLATTVAPLVGTPPQRHAGPANDTELEALLDRLVAEAGENQPTLSDDAVSREGIYRDHP